MSRLRFVLLTLCCSFRRRAPGAAGRIAPRHGSRALGRAPSRRASGTRDRRTMQRRSARCARRRAAPSPRIRSRKRARRPATPFGPDRSRVRRDEAPPRGVPGARRCLCGSRPLARPTTGSPARRTCGARSPRRRREREARPAGHPRGSVVRVARRRGPRTRADRRRRSPLPDALRSKEEESRVYPSPFWSSASIALDCDETARPVRSLAARLLGGRSRRSQVEIALLQN
jgi:hypothetical protein